ncbi:MAG TPA: aspartate dehydrogenase [Steroidobacteraceae bacterium]
MKRVGLIGFGAIGRSIARLWGTLPPDSFLLTGVCARSWHPSEAKPALPPSTALCTDADQLLALQPDYVIEAASHKVIEAHGSKILRSGCSMYLLSVGCLAEEELRTSLIAAAKEGGSQILVPAGALAGFDGLLALAGDGLRSVKYTSRKPCEAWRGTAASDAYDLDGLTQATVIFSGSAGEAARRYPKNANLAAAVALAGLGFERTVVELIADPEAHGNSGSVEAISRSSTLNLSVSSRASSNPKTSANVGPSVISALRNGAASLRFV